MHELVQVERYWSWSNDHGLTTKFNLGPPIDLKMLYGSSEPAHLGGPVPAHGGF